MFRNRLVAWRSASPKLRFGIVGGIIAAIALTGFISDHIPVRNLALADTRKLVSITADGHNRIVTTDATTVGEVLHRADISVGSKDLVEPGLGTALPAGFFNVNVYRAQPYEIVDGSHTITTSSAQQLPRLVVTGAGITLYPEDTVSIGQVQNFVGSTVVGQRITIDRATAVTVAVDGTTTTKRSHATTVGALLSDTGVKLGAKDVVTPGVDTPVVAGLHIGIARVADAVVEVDEVLPFASKTVSDPNSPKGTTTVQTTGVNGKQHVSYRVHYVDGIETSRQTLEVTGRVDPTTQVTAVGTKVIFAGSIEYWRPYVVAAAAQYGVDPNLMLAIMNCESHGNANASNGTHFGLYQYSAATWQSYGNSMSMIYDGPTQISVTAGRLSQPNPTLPWLASKSCWAGSY